MAIAKMKKLTLTAMSYDSDKILDCLQSTGAAQITAADDDAPKIEPRDIANADFAAAEAALLALTNRISAGDEDKKEKSAILKDGFDVSYEDFMAMGERANEEKEVIAKINALSDERNASIAEAGRLKRVRDSADIYRELDTPFCEFTDTAKCAVFLGTVPAANEAAFCEALGEIELCEARALASNEDAVLYEIAALKCAKEDVEKALSSFAFSRCGFSGGMSGREVFEKAERDLEAANKKTDELSAAFLKLKDEVKPLKTYCDYLGYIIEKSEAETNFLSTEKTFTLRAYVPEMAQDFVAKSLDDATGAVFYEFDDLEPDEMPPTLTRNNPVVKNFETITNMYTVPSAKEFDPNFIMSIFYSIFLGFIIADIGYGALMLIVGAIIYFRFSKKGTGLHNLSGVFAIGGIFAIVWGFLFNSFFGFSFEGLTSVMPLAWGDILNDDPDAVMFDMWGFAGIQIPAVLICALLIGVCQIFAGYVCKAIQCWRRNEYGDGFFDGMVWAIFTVGAFVALLGLIDYDPNDAVSPDYTLAYAGGIVAAVALVVAIFTAGRKERLAGKFSKGFGALYGIINYASDILSYARLYGLMLSGAVIANLVTSYSIQFITVSGGAWIVLGVLLMIVGHAFNIAVSLLGAYIHDARLQYVEFYGKFYEGDGTLFTPLGSKHEHVNVTRQREA